MRFTVIRPLNLFFILLLASTSLGQISLSDVSLQSGVTAPHRGVWDPEGSGTGYLAVGQAWGDYDNDGLLDLYVTGNLAGNVLYHNDGEGSFSVSPLSRSLSLPNVPSGGALWADYDNDGWRDLYVVNNGANTLFRNNEGRGFTNVTEAAGVGDTGKGSSAAWGDYDQDGLLDLYVVNWSCLPECDPEIVSLSRDTLYHNLGDGTFEDVSDLLGDKAMGAGFAASFFDADDDGDADLYVVNDKMANPVGNVLWRNDGPGCGGWCFTDASSAAGLDSKMHAMGLAVGDYDNDAKQDVFATNMMSPMQLARNLGGGTFEDSSDAAGLLVTDRYREAVGWGADFLDLDNDGFLDLYVATSGMAGRAPGLYGGQAPAMEDFQRPYTDLVYRNNGDGTFGYTDVFAEDRARATMGFAYADYDNDGQMDLVQGNWNDAYALYHNDTAAQGNWLTVALVGAAGTGVSRDAAGARVYLTDSEGRTQMRELILGSALGAGHDTRLHFGLGAAEVTTLEVRWPNGLKQTFGNVPPNQIFDLRYVNGNADTDLATRWFDLVLDLARDTPGFTPPVAARLFGYLGVTLYESLLPDMDGHTSLVGQLNGLETLPRPDPNERYHALTVVNTALARVAGRLIGAAAPEAQAKIDALEATLMRRFSAEVDIATFEHSVTYALALADAIYTWSQADGGHEGYADNFPGDYSPPGGPGHWVSTPPNFDGAMQPGWGTNRPFVAAPEDCAVAPPVPYSEDPASAFYAEALEVYQTVQALTPEEAEIARYWADDPGATSTPPGHWIAVLTRFLEQGGYSLARSSVAYAQVGIAVSDAFVACWQAKYQYNLVRPLTYIQQVIDTDWNAAEVTDPVLTPPFPEYPSGHSVQSGAAAWVLTELFGEVPFTDYTHADLGLAPRPFESFMAAAQEAAISRLYGGIHYRAAIENGLEQGYCVGQHVAALQFKER